MEKSNIDFNYSHILILINLLKIGANDEFIEITSFQLGKIIDKSQQTASKSILELEKQDLIERIKNNKRFKIKVTSKGYNLLKEINDSISSSLHTSKSKTKIIKGKVIKGMGEGSYYMSLDGYKKQFKSKLGYEPFPGTLNIKLEEKIHIDSKKEIMNYPSIFIEGFKDNNRTFGWVKCHQSFLFKDKKGTFGSEMDPDKSVSGHILFLERTHHDNSLIELISPIHIKQFMKIADGDKVTLKINQLNNFDTQTS